MLRHLPVLCLLVSLIAQTAVGQDITDFYKALPEDYVGLSQSERQELLAEGEFYPEENTPEEVAVYRVSEARSHGEKHLMGVELGFETGQRGFNIKEMKAWTHDEGYTIFGFSRVAGAPAYYGQAELRFFRFEDEQLIELEELIPPELSVDAFVKPDTPDTTQASYENSSSSLVRLYGEEGHVYWMLDDRHLHSDDGDSWLLGNAIRFRWTGTAFERSEPSF